MNNYMREKIEKYHNRCSIRLKGYDYSQAGLYFITICTQNHKHLFGEIVDGEMCLNDAGKHAYKCWLQIPDHFPNTILHEHVIMPNHIHGIIEITSVGAKNLLPLSLPNNNNCTQNGNSYNQIDNDDSAKRANNDSAKRANNDSAKRANNDSAKRANDDSAKRTNNDSAKRANNDSAIRANNDSAKRANDDSAKRANDDSAKRANNDSAKRANNDSAKRANNDSAKRANNDSAKRANNDLPLRGTSKTIGSIVRGFKIGVTKWFRKNINDQFPVNKYVWQRNYWEHIIRNENEYCRISEYIKNNPSKWKHDKLNGGSGNIVMDSASPYNEEIWMV